MNEIFYAGLVDECAGTSEPEDAGSRLSIDRFLRDRLLFRLRHVFEKENFQFFNWKFFFSTFLTVV